MNINQGQRTIKITTQAHTTAISRPSCPPLRRPLRQRLRQGRRHWPPQQRLGLGKDGAIVQRGAAESSSLGSGIHGQGLIPPFLRFSFSWTNEWNCLGRGRRRTRGRERERESPRQELIHPESSGAGRERAGGRCGERRRTLLKGLNLMYLWHVPPSFRDFVSPREYLCLLWRVVSRAARRQVERGMSRCGASFLTLR